MNETLKIYAPYDGQLIKEIRLMSADDCKAKIAKAYSIYSDRKQWLPKHERIAVLERTAQIMTQRIEELTVLAATEGGKPYVDSRVEVMRAINGVKMAAQHVGQLKGQEIPMGLTPASVGRLAFTTTEPIGVVGAISAFNHPLNLIVHQTVPAIAAGAPVVIKPASTTPLSCLNFLDILEEAGLPKGYCQALIMKGADAECLVTDPRLAFFSFIGSAQVGWDLRSRLARGVGSTMEHGGAAPVIVESDADLDQAIPMLVKGGYYHAGQVCVSVQRVYVHDYIVDEFLDRFTQEVKKLRVGNPLDKDTDVGPLITATELDRVDDWVKETQRKGGALVHGGRRLSETCYEPTVMYAPTEGSPLSSKEIFGPVVAVYPFSDRQEVFDRANSLPFCFQAAIFTKHIDRALDAVNKLKATAVMVNDHTAFRVDWMPFGGKEDSGIGIGGIPQSMHELTSEKLVVIKSHLL